MTVHTGGTWNLCSITALLTLQMLYDMYVIGSEKKMKKLCSGNILKMHISLEATSVQSCVTVAEVWGDAAVGLCDEQLPLISKWGQAEVELQWRGVCTTFGANMIARTFMLLYLRYVILCTLETSNQRVRYRFAQRVFCPLQCGLASLCVSWRSVLCQNCERWVETVFVFFSVCVSS